METGIDDTGPEARHRTARVLVAAAVAVQLALFALLARDRSFSLSAGSPSIFLKFGLLWLPFLAAVVASFRGAVRVRPAVIAALVLLFYLSALLSTPPAGIVDLGGGRERVFAGWFSDDWHRYLLDGEAWLDGKNAYRVVPEDLPPADSGPARHAPFVNHPDVETFYSPLAEAWFALVAFSGTGWRGLALGNALAHAAAVLLLASLLRGRHHRTALLLLFALNPLLLVEGALGIHFDPLVMLALLGIHASLERKRRGAAAACWAAAVGLKLFPLILAPYVFRRVGWRRMLVAGAALALLHVPFATRETIAVYGTFASIPVNPSPIAELLPLGIRLALLLAVVAYTNARATREGSAILLPVLAALLLFSTVHPWYLVWILPFAVLDLRNRWPILAWSGLVFAAHSIFVSYFPTGRWAATTPVSEMVWILSLWLFSIAIFFRSGHLRRGGVLLLAWPLLPLLYAGWAFEDGLFGGPWTGAYPYLWWWFDLPAQAPWAMRLAVVWPVRILTGVGGIGPVTAGYIVLGAGHAAALAILWRMLRERLDPRAAGARLILYLSVPWIWLLAFGQVAGSLDGSPTAAWHFSHYAEGVYLPLLFAAILLIRRGARDRWVVPFLVALLLAKESAFFLAAAYWTVKDGISPRRAVVSVALGAAYLGALAFSGLAYPPGVPFVFPSFTAEHLVGGAWGAVIAAAWLITAVFLTVRRGLGRPEALALLAYAALLVSFSMFWETRLWLAAAPLALCPGSGAADGPADHGQA